MVRNQQAQQRRGNRSGRWCAVWIAAFAVLVSLPEHGASSPARHRPPHATAVSLDWATPLIDAAETLQDERLPMILAASCRQRTAFAHAEALHEPLLRYAQSLLQHRFAPVRIAAAEILHAFYLTPSHWPQSVPLQEPAPDSPYRQLYLLCYGSQDQADGLTEEQCRMMAALRHKPLPPVTTPGELAAVLWRPEPPDRPWQAAQFTEQLRPEPLRPVPAALAAWRLAEQGTGELLVAGIAAVTSRGDTPDGQLLAQLTAFTGLARAAGQCGDTILCDSFAAMAGPATGFWRVYGALLAAQAGATVARHPDLYNRGLLDAALTPLTLDWAILALQLSGALETTALSPEEQQALFLRLFAASGLLEQCRPPGPRQLRAMRDAAQFTGSLHLPATAPFAGMGATLADRLRELSPQLTNDQATRWLQTGSLPDPAWRPRLQLAPPVCVAMLEMYGFRRLAARYIREYDSEFWNATAEADAIATVLDHRCRDAGGFTPAAELDRLTALMHTFVRQPAAGLDCLEQERRLAQHRPLTRPIYTVPRADAGIFIDGHAGEREWRDALAITNLDTTVTAGIPSRLRLAAHATGLLLTFTIGYDTGVQPPERAFLLFDPERSYRRFSLVPLPTVEPLPPESLAVELNPDSRTFPRTVELCVPWSYFGCTAAPADGEIWLFNMGLVYRDVRSLAPFWQRVVSMRTADKIRLHLEQSVFLRFGTPYLPEPEPIPARSWHGAIAAAVLLFAAGVAWVWRRRRSRKPSCPPPGGPAA